MDPRRPNRKPNKRALARARGARGYTLIELALVIGILGIVALAVTDFYLSQLSLDRANRRVEGVVRDVQLILDASVYWKEENMGLWPNQDPTKIDIEALVEYGYLRAIPPNRYRLCPGGCGDYEMTGWDRNFYPGPPRRGGEVDDPMAADDLVINFRVWGPGDARLIASQLPQAEVLPPTAAQQGTDERTVKARLLGNVASAQFVRLHNERRPVVFSGLNKGNLQRVASITASTHADPANAGPGIWLTDEGSQSPRWHPEQPQPPQPRLVISETGITASSMHDDDPDHRGATGPGDPGSPTGPGIRLTDDRARDPLTDDVQLGILDADSPKLVISDTGIQVKGGHQGIQLEDGDIQLEDGDIQLEDGDIQLEDGDIVIGPDPMADGLGKQLGDVRQTLQTHNHPHNHP